MIADIGMIEVGVRCPFATAQNMHLVAQLDLIVVVPLLTT